MKRSKLVRHLGDHECELIREGGRHSIFLNRKNNKAAPVPRHREIDGNLVKAICRELEIPEPTER